METNLRITVPKIKSFKSSNKKIVMCTAYDYTMARLVDTAGVDIILIGDSLGSIIQGEETTLPVTLEQMIYHCLCVKRGVTRALVVGDLPFLSYQPSIETAILSAGRMIKESGISAVKLEGGVAMAETIARLVALDIPVMGHVGLTPQSYHRMGGHVLQGKNHSDQATAGSYERILADAKAVEQAGAFSLVVEGVPAELAAEITSSVSIPTIGIGAGADCDGQVLVINDLLGLTVGRIPSFVKQYANLAPIVTQAVQKYAKEVRDGAFPEAREINLKKLVAI